MPLDVLPIITIATFSSDIQNLRSAVRPTKLSSCFVKSKTTFILNSLKSTFQIFSKNHNQIHFQYLNDNITLIH